VIILQIHVDGVLAVPGKSHSPISTRIDRVPTAILTLQRVKAETRYIHSFKRLGGVKSKQNATYAIRLLDAEPRWIATLGEAPQTLASERSDHGTIVRCCLTDVQP